MLEAGSVKGKSSCPQQITAGSNSINNRENFMWSYKPSNSLIFFSRSSFSGLIATTSHFLLTTNEEGKASTCHLIAAIESQPPLSIPCIQVILSFVTAFFQSFSSSSRDTLKISRPLSLYLL